MAWMRMMGTESVAYHQATVLERGDDFSGQALGYYASRGETPLIWGLDQPAPHRTNRRDRSSPSWPAVPAVGPESAPAHGAPGL